MNELIGQAKEKFKLPEDYRILSCYEAGRDGFWIHRALEGQGISNSHFEPLSSRNQVDGLGAR